MIRQVNIVKSEVGRKDLRGLRTDSAAARAEVEDRIVQVK